MGHTIWVDVLGRSKDDPLPRDNSIMLKLSEELDRLSERLKVAKLSGFFDYSVLNEEYGVLEDEFGDPSEELSEAKAADGSDDNDEAGGSWFDPEPALEAVRTIHKRLVQDFADLGWTPDRSRAHWPAELLEELRHCQTVIEEAVSRGRKFRFQIVP